MPYRAAQAASRFRSFHRVDLGPFRAAALYKFGQPGTANANGYQGQIGFDWKGFSFDAIGGHFNDAVSASALGTGSSAAGSIGLVNASQLTDTPGLVNATVSDNTIFMLVRRYNAGPVKIFSGYENIRYANPRTPLASGIGTLGGYILDSVNNNAYTFNKVLQVEWAGAAYSLRPDLDLTLAYYRETQNSFGGSNIATQPAGQAGKVSSNLGTLGCTTNIATNCSGALNAVSLVVDYHLTKRFDIYAGAMFSAVSNGFASGYLTGGTIDPAAGLRFQF